MPCQYMIELMVRNKHADLHKDELTVSFAVQLESEGHCGSMAGTAEASINLFGRSISMHIR